MHVKEIKYCSPTASSTKIQKKNISPKTKSFEDHLNVPDILWYIFKLLKLMGCILVSEAQITRNQQTLENERTVFYFNLCSWSTVKSLVMQLCYPLICYGVTINS